MKKTISVVVITLFLLASNKEARIRFTTYYVTPTELKGHNKPKNESISCITASFTQMLRTTLNSQSQPYKRFSCYGGLGCSLCLTGHSIKYFHKMFSDDNYMDYNPAFTFMSEAIIIQLQRHVTYQTITSASL